MQFLIPVIPLDIDNCVSKDFFAYYPHHTTCTLYAADTEEQPRYTTSPGVRKVANFTIPMPNLPGVMEGEKVDLSIKMYFGEVELRVEGKLESLIRMKTAFLRSVFSCNSWQDIWYNVHF